MEEQQPQPTEGQAEPELLYHYTTLDGLLGVLEKRELWATAVSYLNDTTEFRTGWGALFDLMNPELLESQDESVVNKYAPLLGQSATSIYTASFSAEKTGDDLSQWRAYGGSHSGISLGFSPRYLRAVSLQFLNNWKSSGWIGIDKDPLIKCEYFADRKPFEPDPEILSNVGSIVELEDLSAKVLSFARYAATLRHEKFKAEAEWRIVLVWGGSDSSDAIRFRRIRSFIGPYVCIPLQLDDHPIEIDRVIIGPTPHEEQAKQSVEMLLRRQRVKFREVVNSKVPYRNW
jgi:hypothetical protein